MKIPAADQSAAGGQIPSLVSCFGLVQLGRDQVCSAPLEPPRQNGFFCGGSSGALDVWRFHRARADPRNNNE